MKFGNIYLVIGIVCFCSFFLNGKEQKRIQGQDGVTIELSTTKLSPLFVDQQKFYYSLKTRKLIVQQGAVNGKALNGQFCSYYYNKKLKEKGRFKYGLKVGVWLIWNEKGLLLKQLNFKKGSLHGRQIFYKDDKSVGYSKYKNGVLHGDSLVISNQGDTVYFNQFENGLITESNSKPKVSNVSKKTTKKEKTKKPTSDILKKIQKAEKAEKPKRKLKKPFKRTLKKWFKKEEPQ